MNKLIGGSVWLRQDTKLHFVKVCCLVSKNLNYSFFPWILTRVVYGVLLIELNFLPFLSLLERTSKQAISNHIWLSQTRHASSNKDYLKLCVNWVNIDLLLQRDHEVHFCQKSALDGADMSTSYASSPLKSNL